MPSVIGIFKRDSISSTPGSRRGSIQSIQQSRMDSPRHSIGSDGSHDSGTEGGSPSMNIGPVRRGSAFLTTPIPEVAEETEKDAIEGDEPKKSNSGSEGVLPASPSHSMKSPLEKIDEGDVSNSQTKL